MILIDVNLLVYAYLSRYPQHDGAQRWLAGQLSGATAVGLPWASLLGFLRLVTNPGIFPNPEPMSDAWAQILAWLGAGPVWVPQPTDRHSEILGPLLSLPGVRGNLVPDAHLAALAIEHDLTLCTADRGFARFPGLRWTNPLAA